MEYKKSIEYIHSLNKFGMNFGLSRTERLLELLGNPHKKVKFIHLAGTNGKGSTTAMISNILKEAGYKVGMFTSPYLEEFEERIQINGVNIPKDHLTKCVNEIREIVDVVAEEGLGQPTEFEVITCIMFKYFYDMKIDFGVIEVGLGGKLDSTNVLTPILTVITSISFDHMNILGNTLKEIASEKAGIIKENVPVVLYPQERDALEVIKAKAKELESKIYNVNPISSKFLGVLQKDSKVFQRMQYTIENKSLEINLPLLGKHQIVNCLTAITAIKVLEELGEISISYNVISKGLEEVEWKGRMELLSDKPYILIDGAHNIDGIRKLKENLRTYFNYKNLVLILGILADKQVDEMIREICPLAKEVVAVTPHSDRAELSEVLRDKILEQEIEAISMDNYEEAYRYAVSKIAEDDMLLICGSLYMIGDMRKLIRNNI
ncbi:bifunctional folylpolyglutamate synthase/dihydrofolate synthase [Clostridium sp. 'White wine YQ']|uniref:bifunctional folylpolyglutamate synthase/dihydrofolate synthase n=1 Tax=Clostridium sp. 'White wine YQ' TaxID=3027474 RepID=UPI002366E567|nr:folylpolyglutamate synthase/dihydrofolate synthase family protein [Clostridium sp. 'White wine YQ']MDD7794024.1 bifunctional folylpolyglutamate synthase/dihydrofolate synthase [Clostridium sp. 'White wine YQ']